MGISAVLAVLGIFFGPAVLLARFTRMHPGLIGALSATIIALVYLAAYLVWQKPLLDLVMGLVCWFAIMMPVNTFIAWGLRRLRGVAGEGRAMSYPRTDPEVMTPAGRADVFDRPFWAVCLAIAILGIATWLAIFEHNYHPRIHWYSEDVTILQLGDSGLDFNHPPGAFTIWWQSGRRSVSIWPS